MKPLVDFHDERRGLWTRFNVQPDRIVFRRGRPRSHWIVHLFSLAVLAMLIIGSIQSLLGILFLALFVLLVIWGWFDRRHFDKLRFPIVISKKHTADTSAFKHGRVFDSNKVEQILVRENTNRDVGEDSHLIQIFMQIESAKYLVLLHQDYYSDERVNKINEIANDFRHWLDLAKKTNSQSAQ